MPPDSTGSILFSKIQMQPDPLLYERLNSEIGIYTYRHPDSFGDWQALVMYPNRSVEQASTKVPHELFTSGRIQPIYFNELGGNDQLSLGLGLLVLTILEGNTAIIEAQTLMTRARRAEAGNAIMQIGEQRGASQKARSLVLRQLTRRFGELVPTLQDQVKQLPLDQLEDLGVELLEFKSVADLETWLATN